MDKKIREQIVKRTIAHYASLLEHATRDREPSTDHVLRRIAIPLCEDFVDILKEGNKNDCTEIIDGFSKKCSFHITSKSI